MSTTIEPVQREQAVNFGRRCSVCDHESVTAINGLLADGVLSNRRISAQFKLGTRAVDNHARNHLPKAIVKAAARKGIRAEDIFAERIQHLWNECSEGIQSAKDAVRVVLNADGKLLPVGRDLSALAPLLGQAHANLRLYADRHQLTSQATATTTLNVLCVSIPGPPAPQASSPNVIEATSEVIAPDTEE